MFQGLRMAPISLGKADFRTFARRILAMPALVAIVAAVLFLIAGLVRDGERVRLVGTGTIFAILFAAGVIVELWHARRR
jgi:hypothetical protein